MILKKIKVSFFKFVLATERGFLSPLHVFAYFFQKYLFFTFFKLLAFRGLRGVCSVYLRRGLRSSPSKFNLFFSDLDIGIRCRPDINLESLKKRFTVYKGIFPFLGELEVYEDLELKKLVALSKESTKIHRNLRNVRHLNWLRNQMIAPFSEKKAYYHRIKYYRKYRK